MTPPDAEPGSTPGDRLHRMAVELAAMGQAGLHYAHDRYDRLRGQRMQELAAEIFAIVGDADPAELSIALATDVGHPTPKVDVRGVLFDGSFADPAVLLVREAADGRWTVPGGWADPLEPPRLAAEREFAEEAGLPVRATRLAAVWDGAIHNGHPAVPWHIYKMFFLCERDGDDDPVAGLDGETTDAGWFPLTGLPALSTGRITATQLHRLHEHAADPTLPVDVD